MTKEQLEKQRHTEITELLGKTLTGVSKNGDDIATLSTKFQLHEKDDEHVHKTLAGAVSKLQAGADDSAQHDIEQLQKDLAERKASADTWRSRIWGFVSAGIFAIVTGLVTYYLSTR